MKNYQYEVVALIVEQGPIGEVSYNEDSILVPTLKEAKAKAEEFAANVAKDGGHVEKLTNGLSAYEKGYSDNHRRFDTPYEVIDEEALLEWYNENLT